MPKGGLLGRPVKLVYYDDQSNPATIPGLYTKLLDVDKVDLVVSGYATNMIAPAMPIIMQHNRTFLSLLGLAVNTEFNYPKYFSLHADRRTGAEAELCRGLLRHGDGAEPEAADAGDGRRRRRVPAQRDGRRARTGEEARTEDRLRPDLSAGDDGLHADRPRDPGDQSGSRAGLLLSARYGGHDPRRARGRAEDQAVRRRHGRAAEHRDQDAAWSAAERHRRLRFLAAVVGAGQ